jgi:transcriptional regulator GlxA family with amidase domain
MIGLDVIVPPGGSAAALGITVDVTEAVNRLAERPVFDLRFLGVRAGEQVRGGVVAPTIPLAEAGAARDLVVVLGTGAGDQPTLEALLASPDSGAITDWLGAASRSGAAVAASCTAAFFLGSAGLLDGRRCTTTWWLVPWLARRHPLCDARTDAMVVEDDGVWTAGASFAHMDLMLTLVARHGGPALADEVARRLVVDERTSQARYVAPSHLAASDPMARGLEVYVRERMPAPATLDEIADAMGVSVRTLARRVRASTGLAPMKFVQKIRLDTALHLLQTTRLPHDEIAARVGFADPVALYRLVRRQTGHAPSSFRRAAP